MLEIYKKLEKEGKIGRFDEAGRPRPFAEFPKQMRQPRYELVRRPPTTGEPMGMFERILVDPGLVVHSQREELAYLAENGAEIRGQDPVLDERDDLRKQVADLRSQLETAIAALQAKAGAYIDPEAEKIAMTAKLEPTIPPVRTPPPKPTR